MVEGSPSLYRQSGGVLDPQPTHLYRPILPILAFGRNTCNLCIAYDQQRFHHCLLWQLDIGLDRSRSDLIVKQVAVPYCGTFWCVLIVTPCQDLTDLGIDKLSLAYS